MSRTPSRLLLTLGCVFVVWAAILLAGVIAPLLPGQWRAMSAVVPVMVVVLIGVTAAHHWWTWGSSLIATPLAAFGLYCLVEALRSPDGTRYHSYAVGFAIAGLGSGLALAVVAMALAGLGVVIGKRLHRKDRDDVAPVLKAAGLLDRA